MTDDRTVHAFYESATSTRLEIVRYDRAGKWWMEAGPDDRHPLKLNEAAWFVARGGFTWIEKQPGGRAFDARVRKMIAAHQSETDQPLKNKSLIHFVEGES